MLYYLALHKQAWTASREENMRSSWLTAAAVIAGVHPQFLNRELTEEGLDPLPIRSPKPQGSPCRWFPKKSAQEANEVKDTGIGSGDGEELEEAEKTNIYDAIY